MTNDGENNEDRNNIEAISNPILYCTGITNPLSYLTYTPISSIVGGESNLDVLKNSAASLYGIGLPYTSENIASSLYFTGFKDPTVLAKEELAKQSQMIYGSGELSEIIKSNALYSAVPYTPGSLPYESIMAVNPIRITDDQALTNIHEPLSNLEKRVLELERQSYDKDRRIKQLQEQLDKKKRKSKTKRKSTRTEYDKICKRIEPLEKDASTYRKHWKITKSIHDMDANDKESVPQ